MVMNVIEAFCAAEGLLVIAMRSLLVGNLLPGGGRSRPTAPQPWPNNAGITLDLSKGQKASSALRRFSHAEADANRREIGDESEETGPREACRRHHGGDDGRGSGKLGREDAKIHAGTGRAMNDSRLKSIQDTLNRRVFLAGAGGGLGLLALGSLLGEQARADEKAKAEVLPGLPHFAPKAKRVIYLFQSGAPSQMDLFDPKPELDEQRGEDLPDSIRKGQRLTT